jgi:glycerate kinase
LRRSAAPGIEIVTDALQLAERVADADLVITGEGRIDSQTIHGKVPVGWRRWRSALTYR